MEPREERPHDLIVLLLPFHTTRPQNLVHPKNLWSQPIAVGEILVNQLRRKQSSINSSWKKKEKEKKKRMQIENQSINKSC